MAKTDWTGGGEVAAISTPDAPAPAGHYAQATVANGFVFVSGQLPVGLDRVARADIDFESQARLALGNMLAILGAAGCSARQLARVTVYLVGVDNWPRFNAIYADMLGEARPARTVVPVPELHHGCLVEIDAIAIAPDAAA